MSILGVQKVEELHKEAESLKKKKSELSLSFVQPKWSP